MDAKSARTSFFFPTLAQRVLCGARTMSGAHVKKPAAKVKANTKAQEVAPKKAPSAAKTDEIDEVCDLFRRKRWL